MRGTVDEFPDSGCAIHIRGLTKNFGGFPALRGVDLRVKRGEAVTIFGPNGAGKTTLIKTLSTLSKASGGTFSVAGLRPEENSREIRRKIGVVTHQTFLYDNLTAWENLKFYGRMYDVPCLDARIVQVIEQVKLRHRLHDRVSTFSRGMQQRLSLARAVLHEPEVLFLDEPETGLDREARAILKELLVLPTKQKPTIVMTTHDLEHGLEVSDHIAILVEGRIVYLECARGLDITSLNVTYCRLAGVSS